MNGPPAPPSSRGNSEPHTDWTDLRGSAQWKLAWRRLRLDGWQVNRKRVRRLWREEGLKRPSRPGRKRRRPPTGTPLQRAERPNHVWGLDFCFDETADQRRLKFLNVVDEHTREALATRPARSCDADGVIAIIEELAAQRGAPGFLRMDNGPELIAHALRDWCRLVGTATHYIEPGSPWENPWIESFNSRFRDEFLNITEFGSLLEARVLAEDWRIEYNTYRPHSSLDGLTPELYAARWANQHQPALS